MPALRSMAYLSETFEMFLSGRAVKVAKGHVLKLVRHDDSHHEARVTTLAQVRVESLEDANALEAIAVESAVYGRWEPNYRFEGTALSVAEFAALVAKHPAKFAEPHAVGS